MPFLGDYLGQLLSEIAMARMQADLETVRLAELYAGHPLLRTMPVPHVRLPNVELDVPVMIKASEGPRADETTRGGAKLADMRRKFNDVLTEQLSKAGIALSAAEKQKLGKALDSRLALDGVPTETSIDVHRVADELTSTAVRAIGELKPGKEEIISPTLMAEINVAARLEFLKLRTTPPRLSVLVTTAEIREAGSGENITRLHLKVSEEGMEWTTIESEGLRRDRLVPE